MNRDYITESASRSRTQRRIRKIHNAYVTLLQPLSSNVDLDACIQRLTRIPSWMFDTIDGIYIGDAAFFHKKDVEATYIDGSIYVTANIESTQDLYDSILHELAHAVEDVYPNDLYHDDLIKNEFLKKRNDVCNVLADYGISNTIPNQMWQNTEYDQEFDEFLANSLTYDRLDSLVGNLLSYPYALTDIHEYVATAFSIWFSESPEKAIRYHPAVAQKIQDLCATKGVYNGS